MRNTRIVIIALAALLSASCTSYLNVDKIGKSTIESFFSEIGGITAAGEGLHEEIVSAYTSSTGGYINYGDVTGNTLNINIVDSDEGSRYLYNFEMIPEYVATYPRNVFLRCYAIVTAANNIIYFGGKFRETCKENEVATADKVIGWAHFARALAHFNVCNCYAMPYIYTADASHIGVPVVDHVPGFEEQIGRESVADVYKFVLSDLKKALSLLGDEPLTDCTHISGTACEALLARVYLYMADWENAEKYAKIVMDKVPLSPRSEYVNMFREPKANLGKESIFRLNSYGKTTGMLSGYDPTRSFDFYPDPAMASYFDADDVRKELLTYVVEDCEPDEYKGQTFSAACKHLPYKHITDEDDKHPYEFVLRCSEMYLIHAEALVCGKGDLAGAAADLKAIIARAKGIDPSAVALAYSTKDDMEKLIETERLRELCYEGHSHFDYMRRGKDIVRSATSNSSIKLLKYPDYRFVLPIDETEMESNDAMVQNEGYKMKKG